MNTATEQRTDELAALLAKIRGTSDAETKSAEMLSRALYNRSLDELDLSRASSLWRAVRSRREQCERQATDGYCLSCGEPSSLQQCMDCREGRAEGYRLRYQSIV